MAAYTDAVVREIREYSSPCRIKVNTVFFGGGTPSVLPAEMFLKITYAVSEVFDIADDAEFSVEVNPGAVSADTLRAYRKAGVNRISIGLQSTHADELSSLGRIHSYEEFLQTYREIRACGFSNINIDLMYGIPNQTKSSFSQTLDRVIALGPEHISAYGLIIEEGTVFFEKRTSLNLPSEDSECEMYGIACERLSASGYSHYEISNYAKPGFECKHNLKYWRDEEYIGIGLSAHSCYLGKRYSNTSVLSRYIKDKHPRECLSENAASDPFEYAMLRLRLAEGLSTLEYENKFGAPFAIGKENTVADFVKYGLLKINGERISLTEKGFYLSNHILAQLL